MAPIYNDLRLIRCLPQSNMLFQRLKIYYLRTIFELSMKTCLDIVCDRNVIWIEVVRKRIEPGMIQNVDCVNQLEMSIVN